jgi:hypothetical protein
MVKNTKKKDDISRPKRLSLRLIKLANACNATAELLAETVVALQDNARAAVRLAEEIEEEAKN